MTITDGKESFIIDKKDVTNKKDGYIIGIDDDYSHVKALVVADICTTSIA